MHLVDAFRRIITVFLITAVTTAQDPVVQTASGRVVGTRIEHEVGSVTAFLGIPYARAPKGDLRFAPPQPVEPWTGDRRADRPGASCLQSVETLRRFYPDADVSTLAFDEDCLNLNVFIPGVGRLDDKDPLAVLVWFAGRTPDSAAPNVEPPYALSSTGNIVVVTVNHRVGALGYYTTGQPTGGVRGNMALLDQQRALAWVRDNIARFSGDVGRVTIAGEGEGARAVSLHVVSRTSAGLFSRAISLGGASTERRLPRPGDVGRQAAQFARRLGCYAGAPADVVACLRRKNADEVNAAPAAFPVVVDGWIVERDPYDLWNGSIRNPVDYVVGCSSYGVALDRARKANPEETSMEYAQVEPRLSRILKAEGYPANTTKDGQTIARAVADQYFPDFANHKAILNGYVKLEEDVRCMAPAARIASFLQAANRKTFLYEFERRSSRQRARGLAAMAPAWYALGHPDMANQSLVDPEDIQLSDDIITMISTFVRKGFPIWVDRNATPVAVIDWPEFDPHNDTRYAALDADFDADHFRSRPNPRGVSFWNVLLPGLLKQTRMAPKPRTVVIETKENDLIFDKRAMLYVLIFLVVLCVVLLFGMLGAFFLYYDARREQKRRRDKAEEENKYSETIDY